MFLPTSGNAKRNDIGSGQTVIKKEDAKKIYGKEEIIR